MPTKRVFTTFLMEKKDRKIHPPHTHKKRKEKERKEGRKEGRKEKQTPKGRNKKKMNQAIKNNCKKIILEKQHSKQYLKLCVKT